jgi:hypothetical protein
LRAESERFCKFCCVNAVVLMNDEAAKKQQNRDVKALIHSELKSTATDEIFVNDMIIIIISCFY